eukprot:Anaeramoba_flamelloidesa855528_8.p2 GENE.a855528_8~~a855528_8.p2  ORF type:complete len:107 (+),score=14.00 a855528_8:67-387(+)
MGLLGTLRVHVLVAGPVGGTGLAQVVATVGGAAYGGVGRKRRTLSHAVRKYPPGDCINGKRTLHCSKSGNPRYAEYAGFFPVARENPAGYLKKGRKGKKECKKGKT